MKLSRLHGLRTALAKPIVAIPTALTLLVVEATAQASASPWENVGAIRANIRNGAGVGFTDGADKLTLKFMIDRNFNF